MTPLSATRFRVPWAALVLLCLMPLGAAFGQDAASALEIVATAVRQNGYDCRSPESATPDPGRTTPEEKTWIVRCESGNYRVKFLGDTGAEVTPLEP